MKGLRHALIVGSLCVCACQTAKVEEQVVKEPVEPVADVWRCSDELDRIGLLTGDVEDKVLYRLSISPKVLMTLDEYDDLGYVKEFSLFANGARQHYRLEKVEPGAAIMLERRYNVTVPGKKPQMLELGIKEKIGPNKMSTGAVQIRFTRLSKAPKLDAEASQKLNDANRKHLYDAQLETAQAIFDSVAKYIERNDLELKDAIKSKPVAFQNPAQIKHFAQSLALAKGLQGALVDACPQIEKASAPYTKTQALVEAQASRLQQFARTRMDELKAYKFAGKNLSRSTVAACMAALDGSFVEPLALTEGVKLQQIDKSNGSIYVGVNAVDPNTKLVSSLLVVSGNQVWTADIPLAATERTGNDFDGGQLVQRSLRMEIGGRIFFVELGELIDSNGKKVEHAQAKADNEASEQLFLPSTMLSSIARGDRATRKFITVDLKPVPESSELNTRLEEALIAQLSIASGLIEQMSPDDPTRSPVEFVLWQAEAALRLQCPRLPGSRTEQTWNRFIELMQSRLERL